MVGDFPRLLDDYGQRVTVCRGEAEAETRAFVQPVTERREDWRQELPTPLGIVKRTRWLYLGGPDVPLEDLDATLVRWQGRALRIQTARPVYIGEKISHWWAVLEERDGG